MADNASSTSNIHNSAPTNLNFRGTWSALLTYEIDDLVYYNSCDYACIVGNLNKQPDTQTAYWTLFLNGLSASNLISGTAAAPGIGDATIPTSGLYDNAGAVAVAYSGSKRASFNDTDTEITKRIKTENGSAAAPAFAFISDPTTGGFTYGTGDYAISLGGTQKFLLQPGNAIFSGPALSTTNSTQAFNTTNASMFTAGGLGVVKDAKIGDSTPSTSSTTGALVLSGGGGLGIACTSNATSSTNGGSFTSAGGGAFAQDFYIGGTFTTPNPIAGISSYRKKGGTFMTINTNTDTECATILYNGAATQVGTGVTFSSGTFTCAATGVYLLSVSAVWAASTGTGYRYLAWCRNSAATNIVAGIMVPALTVAQPMNVTTVVFANATDTFFVNCKHTEGVNLNISASAHNLVSVLRIA